MQIWGATVGKVDMEFLDEVCRLKSLWGLTIPCWAQVVIWGENYGNIGEKEGVGVNVVPEACCLSWVQGEEDIGVEKEVGGEGWLGKGVNEGRFEVIVCDLLD